MTHSREIRLYRNLGEYGVTAFYKDAVVEIIAYGFNYDGNYNLSWYPSFWIKNQNSGNYLNAIDIVINYCTGCDKWIVDAIGVDRTHTHNYYRAVGS